MNYIIQHEKNIGALSSTIKADTHKHWMLQLFLSRDDNLDIVVMDKKISCRCIVIDMNTKHIFSTNHKAHFTLLIDPTSKLAVQIRRYFLKGNAYYIFPEQIAVELQEELVKLMWLVNASTFHLFLNKIYAVFYVQSGTSDLDERIRYLLNKINACDCGIEDHSLKDYAGELALSKSRLAHLFKLQTGIPLKSYIVLHKLERAYEVIFNGGSITTAAISAGFDSSAHLAYTNKKMTGMSARGILNDSEFLKVSI